jgi:hypothetical protein
MIVANDKGDHFRFGSVFIKKDNKTEILKKTRPVSVRFIFLGPKPVQTGLARFFPVWLGFFGLARFFASLARFFLIWVRFSFFSFRLIKPKPNRTGRFF